MTDLQYDVMEKDWNTTGIPINSNYPWSWEHIKYINIHWPGGNRYWTSGKDFFNKVHRDYSRNRGYSIGYSAGVDNDTGQTFQCRGLRYRAASNGDEEDKDDTLLPKMLDNREVFSIIVNQGMDETVTLRAIGGVQRLVDQLLTIRPSLVINGHNDLDWTGCPGPEIQQLISEKAFYPPKVATMKINSLIIRFDGTEDQFVCLPMSRETKERFGALGHAPIVVRSELSPVQLSQEIGYPLTPM